MSKTIVITGASRGIGFALTQLALQQGHRIYALSRNIQPLKKSERLYPYRIDLSEEQSLPIFAKWLIEQHASIVN
jgi:3-oxoacyl-[acyl-carrier protein] reductase